MKKIVCLKVLVAFIFVAGFSAGLLAEERSYQNRFGEVIDIPTADVVDHYGYNVSFRFGQEGALQAKTAFGVFPRLNLGFGLDGERVLGTEDARMNKPTINVKFRLFDGQGAIPALAIGFDGQGYVFNKALDEYEQREKGFYLVGTTEILVPGFLLHLGGNIFDFDEGDTTRGFMGLSYVYQNTLGFMFEYDHATEYKERRINYGLKYFITPVFTVDAVARNIPEAPRRSKRETERIIRLSYTGSF